MGEEEVKLLGMWASPFACRVEIALKLKGVRYDYIDEDLYNKSPLLLEYNPVHEKVPVLVHHGKPIVESLVILEYIDETWKGNPLLPQDPHQRATARFWANFTDNHCIAAVRRTMTSGGGGEKVEEGANEALKLLENELKEKKFFGGESIGLVDLAASPLALWAGIAQEVLGMKLITPEKFPKLHKWADEFVGCSAVREVMPPRDKLFAHFKALYQAKAAASKPT